MNVEGAARWTNAMPTVAGRVAAKQTEQNRTAGKATEQKASREAHLNTNGRKGNSSSVRSDTQGVAGKTAGSRT